LLVKLLLGLAFVVTNIARSLLRAVAGDATDDRILLAHEAIRSTLGVALGACSFVLGFASNVFLFAVALLVLPSSGVSDSLDCGALHGMALIGVFAWAVIRRHGVD